jgi:hypothetical protein
MQQTLEPDVFTATVAPIIRVAKEGGASARTLSEAFLDVMTDLYGDVDVKETSAMVGFLQLLNSEGGSVSAKNAAKLYGGPNDFSEEAVRKAARSGQLIAIRDGNGNLHFPAWQFSPRGGTLPGLKDVLAIFDHQPHKDDIARATFFLNPTSRLGGISPLGALRSGDPELLSTVKQLALEAAE